MSSRIYMKYGNYFFTPVPLLTINKEYHKTEDSKIIGATFHLDLQGTLVSYPSGGYPNIDTQQDNLLEALEVDGNLFYLFCSGDGTTTDIIKSYARVNPITFNPSPDNWVFTCPYSAQLEFDDLGLAISGGGPFSTAFSTAFMSESSTVSGMYIRDASEDWQLEFLEAAPYQFTLATLGTDRNPHQLRLVHNVSAVGKRHYEANGLVKEAWEQAKTYVLTKIGYDATQVIASGIFNLSTTGLVPFNHTRSQTVNETDGSFAISESWTVISNTGVGIIPNGIEDFSVSVRKSVQSDITSVSIEGTIEGLETKHYGLVPGEYSIPITKYEAASGFFDTLEPRLYERCLLIAGSTPRRSLNINPLSQVVGHNPTRGTVNYTYEFDDRPYNIISGAISEKITISDDAPVDVFASLTIPGRSAGPVLQDLATVTSRVRSLSIEVVTIPYSGGVNNTTDVANLFSATPEVAVNNLLEQFRQHLSGLYGAIYLSADRPSWQPKDGIYNREVSYTISSC